MKINWLNISIISLLCFTSNVYAFSFGGFKSGITIDKAISIAGQGKSKLIKFDKAHNASNAMQYFLDDERFDILLEFSKDSQQLFSLSITDIKSKDIKKLETNFREFKATLETIYGEPIIEKHTIAIIGIPKTVSDKPDTYIYENNEDKVLLTYSEKLQLLSLRYNWKLLKDDIEDRE